MNKDIEELISACSPIVRALSVSDIANTDTHISDADGQNFIAAYRKVTKKTCHTLQPQEAVLLHNLAACLDVCMPLVERCVKNEKLLNKNSASPIKQMSWQIRHQEFSKIIEQAIEVLKADNREIYF